MIFERLRLPICKLLSNQSSSSWKVESVSLLCCPQNPRGLRRLQCALLARSYVPREGTWGSTALPPHHRLSEAKSQGWQRREGAAGAGSLPALEGDGSDQLVALVEVGTAQHVRPHTRTRDPTLLTGAGHCQEIPGGHVGGELCQRTRGAPRGATAGHTDTRAPGDWGQGIPPKRPRPSPPDAAAGRGSRRGGAPCPAGGGRRSRRLRRRSGARSEYVSVPLLLLRLPLCRAALSREGPPPPRSMGSCWLRLAVLLALGACPSLEYEGREGKEGGGWGRGAPRGGASAGGAEGNRERGAGGLLPPGCCPPAAAPQPGAPAGAAAEPHGAPAAFWGRGAGAGGPSFPPRPERFVSSPVFSFPWPVPLAGPGAAVS